MEDTMILALYWDRKEHAIEETRQKYGEYCKTIAVNLLGDNRDVEECLNDTFLNAWNAIPPQKPKVFAAYLGKITRNLSLNKLKEKQTKKRGSGEVPLIFEELEEFLTDSDDQTENQFEYERIKQLLSAFLRDVEAESRVLFVRRYFYADSIEAICNRYHFSKSKVKTSLFRTREKLKDYLKKEGVVL